LHVSSSNHFETIPLHPFAPRPLLVYAGIASPSFWVEFAISRAAKFTWRVRRLRLLRAALR